MHAHAQRLRLVSFNIAHARGWMPHQGFVTHAGIRRNLERIAEVIRSLEPDIVALQEIDSDSVWNGSFDHVSRLRELTGLGYAAFGASNDLAPGGRLRICYGNALLSKHPIVLAEAHRFGSRLLGEKGLLYAELAWHHHILPVISLHLHHSSRAQRRRQAAHLLRLIEHRASTERMDTRRLEPIIGGDFNCAAHTRGDAAAWLLDEAPALRSYRAAPGHTRTFPSLRPTRMLDYWLLPRQWRVHDSGALPGRTSDHLPIFVEVDVPLPPRATA